MVEKNGITILAIDDHPLFRKGVSDLLGMDESMTLIGEAANGVDGLRLAQELSPDFILLDINMKGMDGLETLAALREAGIEARVLMLTVSDNEDDVIAALRLGADGYLLKDMEPEDILASLRRAAAGRVVISDRLTQLIAHALREEKKSPAGRQAPNLTDREQEILQLIAQGLSNKIIASQLGISEGTVKVHVKHLLKKLKLHSRVEAAVWALSNLTSRRS
ncbi:MAG: two-component system response regulator NarL [Gammaproteobacteria bacterium]|nr:two-component system response regulator NarL [Gammaproteobacteria bacterium]